MFPGSKSNTTDLDDDVTSINDHAARFARANLPATDRRGHYLLVGAIWQDRPDRSFALNKSLVNDDSIPDIIKNGGDSPLSITGGEDRLSSTAMESFTQAVNSFRTASVATTRGPPPPAASPGPRPDGAHDPGTEDDQRQPHLQRESPD